MKTSNQAESIPLRNSGKVMLAIERSLPAPSVRAANSRSAESVYNAVVKFEYAIGKKRVANATISIQAVP